MCMRVCVHACVCVCVFVLWYVCVCFVRVCVCVLGKTEIPRAPHNNDTSARTHTLTGGVITSVDAVANFIVRPRSRLLLQNLGRTRLLL